MAKVVTLFDSWFTTAMCLPSGKIMISLGYAPLVGRLNFGSSIPVCSSMANIVVSLHPAVVQNKYLPSGDRVMASAASCFSSFAPITVSTL